MRATIRCAALLITLALPVDSVGAQSSLGPTPGISRLVPAPHPAAPLERGVETLQIDRGSNAPVVSEERAGPATEIVSATATGVFFGAIAGGIYGQSQEGCTECDVWGAVAGGFLGGLVGLATGIAVSIW